jgi:hypothetical protein
MAGHRRFPRCGPTVTCRLVLGELILGDSLTLDEAGAVWLRRARRRVHTLVAGRIFKHSWATRPLPELPLFGEPAADGTITEAGRAAFVGRGR